MLGRWLPRGVDRKAGRDREPETEPDLNAGRRTGPDTGYMSIAGPAGDFAIETMEELGFPPATTPHRGGETLALAALVRASVPEGVIGVCRSVVKT